MARNPDYYFTYDASRFSFQHYQEETEVVFSTFVNSVIEVLEDEYAIRGLKIVNCQLDRNERGRVIIDNPDVELGGFHIVVYFTTDNKLGISDLAYTLNRYNYRGIELGSVLNSIHRKLVANKLCGSDSRIEEKKAGGCYVATAVYGSYDCPEVWTLRRFRDYNLANSSIGRIFIKLYYATSPTLVKYFGNSKIFKLICKIPLDSLVNHLNKIGYEDSEYEDI